jgi:hypothetical protein
VESLLYAGKAIALYLYVRVLMQTMLFIHLSLLKFITDENIMICNLYSKFFRAVAELEYLLTTEANRSFIHWKFEGD